jgi:cyanophycinase-like exopeptidase
VLPHHDRFGHRWAEPLTTQLPGVVLLGIDERTAMVWNNTSEDWQVSGQGGVTVYRNGQIENYSAEQGFTF